ncbi:hypothetical protein CFBP498_49850 (plasmid) [Xanthomonas hortorum pv. vitians]|uniref:Uncharacterized protein n=1 Tax=Xanthomonas hortorum pv. vitians TaxID=83224 RepID=A0A6V7FKX7_9XANT|nr:hypothetical protein CFBP498_49850 [Xanthomonas hortorum pv. vitians]CAD0363948.1 hypothetical protein CFBP498_49850 [Xanthomonas hortorum pv. vitians]
MYSRKQPRSRQLEIRPAGGDHQVVTVSSDRSQRRARPARVLCGDGDRKWRTGGATGSGSVSRWNRR